MFFNNNTTEFTYIVEKENKLTNLVLDEMLFSIRLYRKAKESKNIKIYKSNLNLESLKNIDKKKLYNFLNIENNKDFERLISQKFKLNLNKENLKKLKGTNSLSKNDLYLLSVLLNENYIKNKCEIPKDNLNLKPFDIVHIKLEDEPFKDPPLKIENFSFENIKENEIIKNNNKLKILYQDCDILAVFKWDILCHQREDKIEKEPSLLDFLRYYFLENKLKTKPRFISRLDKNTRGIVLISKSPYGQYLLGLKDSNSTNKIFKKTFKKYYLLITFGKIKEKSGIIKTSIVKDNDIKRKILKEDFSFSDNLRKNIEISKEEALKNNYLIKEAITKYKVLKEKTFTKNSKEYTFNLVQCQLLTGRTHQIRCHMNYINSSIIGDNIYNDSYNNLNENCEASVFYNELLKNLNIHLTGQALLANHVEFISPRKKGLNKITIKDQFMEELVEKIFNKED